MCRWHYTDLSVSLSNTNLNFSQEDPELTCSASTCSYNGKNNFSSTQPFALFSFRAVTSGSLQEASACCSTSRLRL